MHQHIVLQLVLAGLVWSIPTVSELVGRQQESIPQYVFDHAPLCWLDDKEAYWPSSLTTHLENVFPAVDATKIANAASPLTLANLGALNADGNGGVDVYLTAKEGIDANPQPSWFYGVKPDSSLSAPGGVVIIADKGDGIVDVFYFYFYSYNQGTWFLGLPALELGDHVGDWEHNMIRFVNGEPSAIYFSQHSSGQAFRFSVIDKDPNSGRPLNFPARGSHANYPTSGQHDHTIPGVDLPVGALLEYTSEGTLWDPLTQALFYNYNVTTSTFTPLNGQPTAFLSFLGHWGDDELPLSNSNQVDFFGFRKYTGGPTGPEDKNLNRSAVCQSSPCIVIEIPPLHLKE
ncbi:hypothetical protein DV738_g5389, partial [Chaetothyriales sp. CBS 135597]